MFLGFSPGQITGFLGDVTESAVRTAKNHPKGLVGAFIAADIGVTAATAPKNDLATDITSSVGGQIGGTVGGILGAMTPIPGGALIGMTVGDQIVRSGIGKGLRTGLRVAHTAEHLDTGGRYKDTEIAYTMRQRASIEMSQSLLNARQYLGKEGNLMHV